MDSILNHIPAWPSLWTSVGLDMVGVGGLSVICKQLTEETCKSLDSAYCGNSSSPSLRASRDASQGNSSSPSLSASRDVNLGKSSSSSLRKMSTLEFLKTKVRRHGRSTSDSSEHLRLQQQQRQQHLLRQQQRQVLRQQSAVYQVSVKPRWAIYTLLHLYRYFIVHLILL